jgi:hypothetical protein
MATNFPANPSNGDTHAGFTFNSATGAWESSAVTPAAQDPAVTVYATVDDLPTSGVTTGQQAFVSATNRLYIWNSSGWYNIALINTTPSISGASASYTLATDGTPTVVTITAADPEGLPITYDIVSDTSGNTATVTSNNNIFTITPSTNDADAGTFSLTFRASDGVNIASAISEFTLAFQVQNSNYTTALITSVGTNNQVNNDFVDSSTNSHTITAAGNATQSTFSPYRHGGYSIFCDGANVMDLGFSTLNSGNWTFECWALVEVGETILGKYGGGNQLEAFGVSGTTGYMYTHTNVGVETPTCNTDLRDGKWHYLVWERYNGTYYYWADGSLEASFANSETPGATGNWGLGGVASGRFKGNIKEARFSLSTAVYSGSAPTTPTEPQTTSNATDAFFTGVGLEIKDYSSNNRTFTVPSTFITAPTTPYDYTTYSAGTNGGSMYFSDGNAYLTASPTAPGTGDFCYECWINVPQASDDAILETRTANQSPYGFTLTVLDPSTIRIYSNNAKITASGLSYLNQWTHLCVEKVGSTTTLYINGTSFGTTTDLSNMSDTTFRIGESQQYGAFSGHIADFRYVRGGYVYNGNFTPPTAPLTAISGTELLINGTNAGIIDKSQSVKTLTLVGDTKSSTTQTKYLTSSMAFDGTGDRIEVANSTELQMGTGDFTFEWWWYPTAAAIMRPICINGTGAGSWSIIMYANQTFDLAFATSPVFSSAVSYSINTWEHIAIVRENGTVTCYVDGISQQSATNTTNLNATTVLGIGYDTAASSQAYQGYMSDVRITKGLARYTSSFTPPTAALKG